MDDDVQAYIDAIEPDHRPLFDRIQRLVLDVHPSARVVLSYKMPTYVVGKKRLYVGAWTHGLSLYGWDAERVAPFIERHPELKTRKGTIQLRPSDLDDIGDDELLDLFRVSLAP